MFNVRGQNTVNQNGKPVALFSQSPKFYREKIFVVEKEAIKRLRYFLLGRRFTIVTDQKSEAYMYNIKHKNTIKIEKYHIGD